MNITFSRSLRMCGSAVVLASALFTGTATAS